MKQQESALVVLWQLIGPSSGQDGVPLRGSYGVTELSAPRGAWGLMAERGSSRLDRPERKLVAYANAERKEVGDAITSIGAFK